MADEVVLFDQQQTYINLESFIECFNERSEVTHRIALYCESFGIAVVQPNELVETESALPKNMQARTMATRLQIEPPPSKILADFFNVRMNCKQDYYFNMP